MNLAVKPTVRPMLARRADGLPLEGNWIFEPKWDGFRVIVFRDAQEIWSRGKDLAWEPLRPELVAEVAYDHLQGDRFRHVAQFRRWRRDKKPADCTYAQLEVVPPEELRNIFGRG